MVSKDEYADLDRDALDLAEGALLNMGFTKPGNVGNPRAWAAAAVRAYAKYQQYKYARHRTPVVLGKHLPSMTREALEGAHAELAAEYAKLQGEFQRARARWWNPWSW